MGIDANNGSIGEAAAVCRCLSVHWTAAAGLCFGLDCERVKLD